MDFVGDMTIHHIDHIKELIGLTDSKSLLDFGCGGGYLLEQINVKEKSGFEINEAALKECKARGITATNDWDNIKDNSKDIIISNHALEHVPHPLMTLKNLYSKLKAGGETIIVVPCEQPHEAEFVYKDDDRNQHLHTWCPQSLGNLAKLAGFKVVSCGVLRHQWPNDWRSRYKDPSFHKDCLEHAKRTNHHQVKLVCAKE